MRVADSRHSDCAAVAFHVLRSTCRSRSALAALHSFHRGSINPINPPTATSSVAQPLAPARFCRLFSSPILLRRFAAKIQFP